MPSLAAISKIDFPYRVEQQKVKEGARYLFMCWRDPFSKGFVIVYGLIVSKGLGFISEMVLIQMQNK